MNLHKPSNIITDEKYAPYFSQTATCSVCGQEINRFEYDDDDMGWIWTKWTAEKQGKQPWSQCFGVSA